MKKKILLVAIAVVTLANTSLRVCVYNFSIKSYRDYWVKYTVVEE